MPDNIRAGFWNLHGFNSKTLGNKLQLPELRNLSCSFDIFGMVETHATLDSDLEIENFVNYRKFTLYKNA